MSDFSPALETARDSVSGTEDVRRSKSTSILDALLDSRTRTPFEPCANKDQMAVADPLPPTLITASAPAMQSPTSAFSRFSQLRRAEAPQNNFQSAPFTLEGIALLLDRVSPTNDLAYLTEDYYSTSSDIVRTSGEVSSGQRRLQKSCVQNGKLLRRTKSVRFADTQGLPLIEAIHQLSVGDSSYTENKIVPYNDNCEFQPVKLVSCRQSKENTSLLTTAVTTPAPVAKKPESYALRLEPPALAPLPLSVPPVPSQINRQLSPPANRRVLRFNQPGSEPGFYERVSRDNIVLESVRDEPRMVRGVIRVSNISYHKEVTVRWTHDHWRAYHDTNAVFSANDGHTDRFTFELPANGEDIEFALRYKCDGEEYWDSNRGKNYVIEGLR